MNTALADGVPMLLATAGTGEPDIAFKGSLMVWDTDHLAYWERSLGEQLEALRANPRVVASYRRPGTPPLRFYGEAQLFADGEMRERIWERVIEQEKKNDPERNGLGVLIRIDRVRQGRAVIQQR